MNQNNHFQFAVNDTPVSWTLHDRGTWQLEDNILTICDGWASTDDLEMKNFIFDFEARCSSDTPQVQIWAGFRHYSRDYRYVAALRGGNNNHLYLARMGAEGYDKMLDLRPLEWSAQPGKWYHIRIVCAGRTIAMYVNHQEKPLLLVKDEAAPFETGGIALGGSFLPTQYRNISLQPVSEDFLNHAVSEDSYLSCVTLSAEEKIKKRQKDRAKYRSFVVSRLPEEHLELSLNGNWLFVPDYEVFQNPAAFDCDDSAAHVMPVPASWIPLKAWLEGESMGDLNKGMNDTYLVEENIRCMNQTFDYEKTQFAWYRHYLDLPIGICKKHVILDFEGIALISAVYINGTKVHENIGMFAPMQIDISDHVKEGRNLIAVEVHRRLSSESEHAFHSASIDDKYATAWDILDEKKVAVSQWEHREFCTDDIPHGFYSDNPGGIWKNAKLIITDKIHVNECYFRPALEDAAIQVEYANTGVADREVSLFYSLTHKTTGEYLCGGPVEKLLLKAGEKRSISFTTPKVKPLLWGPKTPNLYDLCFTLENNGQVLDTFHEQVGFRTVEFDGSTLLYNGQPLWVRGGNHMPAHVNPNNRELARAFMTMALKHNVIASRTHVSPWSSVWLDAADEAGLLVSFEGTWSWLMLEHIPSERSIRIWKEELEALLVRNRNRPSLFLMTMNNEMKFYLHEAPDEVVIEKAHFLESGIRAARKTVPHLPLVCDSAYYRKHAVRSGRYQRIITKYGYDDGDMDDPHGYFGWYNPCFFHFMNGEFGEEYTLPGRPCMSQECSTGYPRAEDGLPTRAYLFMHQTPQTTVGKKAYEYCDPSIFLTRQAMLTKELAETLRRVEHDRTCGVILFAFETWFYNQSDANRIQPMLTALKLKAAYQPVLASAELFGRHFYMGSVLKTAVTLINDSNDHGTLTAPIVKITLEENGSAFAGAELCFADLAYFKTCTLPIALPIPKLAGVSRIDAVLVLRVLENDRVISENEYDVLIASKDWALGTCKDKAGTAAAETNTGSNAAAFAKAARDCWYMPDDAEAARLLSFYHVAAQPWADLPSLVGRTGQLYVSRPISETEGQILSDFVKNGGNVFLLDQRQLPNTLFDGQKVPFTQHRQEIVTMNIPESAVFDGIKPLDLSWFADGRNVPYAAHGRYSIDRFDKTLSVLAETLEWHGYINKPTDYKLFGGTPLFSAKVGKGHVLVSAVRTDAVPQDPVASRLMRNLIAWDFDEK